jgi:hypothetical protein
VHPLSVHVEVYQASDSTGASKGQQQPVAALAFSYYTQLQLVGVVAGSADDDAMLTDLFLGDAGDGKLLESLPVSCSVAVDRDAACQSATSWRSPVCLA